MRSDPFDNHYIHANQRQSNRQSHDSSSLMKYGQMNLNNVSKFKSLNAIKFDNSLSNFQQELQRMTNKIQLKTYKKHQNKARAYTQYTESAAEQQLTQRNKLKSVSIMNKKDSTVQLQNELDEIKRLLQRQNQSNSIQSKFQRLLTQIQKKNSTSLSQPSIPMQGSYNPYMYMYPPYQVCPQVAYQPSSRNHRYRKPSQDFLSQYESSRRQSSRKPSEISVYTSKKSTKPIYMSKGKRMSKLRKVFFVVTFVFLLRKQAKKLALQRKNSLRKFWIDKFDTQVQHLKNWLLDSLKYTLSIVIQKKNLNFNFFDQPKTKVKRQKQRLVLKLVLVSVQQLKKIANPKDSSLFSEMLTVICRSGSFPISRFWTVLQMEQLRISQYYGFIRGDIQTQKFLICVFVFIKMLIFNMLLQPYKFDSTNFKKNTQPILSNLFLVASLLYHAVKQVLDQYISGPKGSQIYEPGNWLSVKKQFISECCQPLKYDTNTTQQGQYISGMLAKELFNEMLQLNQQNKRSWVQIKDNIKTIIDSLYKDMILKSKVIKNNIYQKMYS